MAQISEHEKQIEEKISTVLAPDINFTGTLRFTTSLMIKGELNGEIEADGHLVVGSTAKIQASVKAGRITNYGEIIGDLEAKQLLEMKANAVQTGDVKTRDLIIESGCCINGKIEMSERDKEQQNS